jgi:glycolate oxidase
MTRPAGPTRTDDPTTDGPLQRVTADLVRALGADQVVTDRQRRRTYECDGLAHYKVVPGLVVLARDADDVAATVRSCAAHGVPSPRPRACSS